jgi:ferredoxin-NADP reductase
MSAVKNPTGYIVKLEGRHDVADRTMAFQFEKPMGFAFNAGQYMQLTLVNPPETDAEGDIRTFSIASAPHEDMLMIATRLRGSAFKHVLQTMPLHSQLRLNGPYGSFHLHENAARAAVFLAGGIGITPFRSMIVRAAKEALPHQIVLFSSNRRPEDAPFLDELLQLQKTNPNFKMVATMTGLTESKLKWTGETGHIDAAMLGKHLKGITSPIYYVAGPPAMVSGLQAMLRAAGVDDDDIHAEEFAGY